MKIVVKYAAGAYRADKPKGGTSEERPHGGNTGMGLRGAAYWDALQRERNLTRKADVTMLATNRASGIVALLAEQERIKRDVLASLRAEGYRRLPRRA